MEKSVVDFIEGARLAAAPTDDVPAGTQAVFDAFQRSRGNVPNLFRIAAHRPAIVETLYAHMQAVMGPGTVSTLLKELVACRVSQINGCEYCLASHTKLVKRMGGNDAQVEALAAGDYASFEPGWAAALAYGAEIAQVGGRVSDETFFRVAEHWDPAQIVELTTAATMFSYFNRFANALRIPITT
jgi:uncharacterized peroxidase-related enzyme